MPVVGVLIREARERAGLTQAQLARRMGTTQSAVARLEANDSNPRVETLDRALRAANSKLRVESYEGPQEVDETLIAAQLKFTPAQRLGSHAQTRANLVALAKQVEAGRHAI